MRGQDSTLARVALPVLLKVVASDPSYFVRENCVSALGRVARPAVYVALLKTLERETDYRVRIAAIRSMPGPNVTPFLISYSSFSAEKLLLEDFQYKPYHWFYTSASRRLTSPLSQEALSAAEWFLRTPPDTTVLFISNKKAYSLSMLQLARRVSHWRARATLLQVALRYAYSPVLADTIRQRYQRTPNQYEKAALLTALSEDPAQFDFLAKEAALTTGPPIVPGTALAALVSLREKKSFLAARQADFTAALRRALAGGDVAQLGTAAEALANPALVPAPQPDDLAALRQAQSKLKLPSEIEAWLGLQQALDKLEKKPTPTPAPVGPAASTPLIGRWCRRFRWGSGCG